MFPFIGADAAQRRAWDIVIAGSSFASMFLLAGLPREWSILIVEKGDVVPHGKQMQSRAHGVAEHFAMTNTSGHAKSWAAHTLFGGNSNCWWAGTPRLHPNDFRLRSAYGIGFDWPIGYDDLQNAYERAEDIMEVNGGGSDHILPRRRSFPYRSHAPSRSDLALQAASRDWFAQPTARATGGSRAPCCATGVCNLCPIDSKFTILNGIQNFLHPGAKLLLNAEVRSLSASGGRIERADVRTEGRDISVQGATFALGTNAIFNAAILLRSGFEAPALGHYLHEQVSRTAIIDLADQDNYFGGTSVTGHGYTFYDGAHRSQRAAVMMENWNSLPQLRTEPGKWLQRMQLRLVAEDLPSPDNRVVLDDDDEPHIYWKGHSSYAFDGIEAATTALPDVLPFRVEGLDIGPANETESHIIGTTRMGRTIEEGVVDADLRSFEHRNVLVLGAGAFPTCSPANPTLTLAALSLRAADSLRQGGEPL